ncbi:MAG: S8 family serine peptidase [Caldithrix sp.]|nr:S8 family serine peptidase [Caldithrix sp.]
MKRLIQIFVYPLFMLAALTEVSFGEKWHEQQFLVTLHENAPAIHNTLLDKPNLNRFDTLQSVIRKHNINRIEPWLKSADTDDVVGNINLSKIYRFHLKIRPDAETFKTIIRDFSRLETVLSACPEFKMQINTPVRPLIVNDPRRDMQWYVDKIMANYAWALWPDGFPTESTILLGVVDTGYDYLHPDLDEILFKNFREDANGDGVLDDKDVNGVDDDNNGFVDDFSGWDFVGASQDDSADNDIRPPSSGNRDILSHGTHVAGIMSAMANNGVGIAGIAYNSKIIATKHSYDTDYDKGYLYDAYDGILYCAKMGAKVINCSWGSQLDLDDYPEYAQNVRALLDLVTDEYGAIVVCAAGNNNTNNDDTHHYPSDFEQTLAVAALTSGDQKASFSNYGRVIDISAPGVGILSTIHDIAGGYASWQGTSMASPVVAGALGLLWNYYPHQSPDWISQAILETADDIDERNASYKNQLGAGRINVFNAIAREIYPNIRLHDYTLRRLPSQRISPLKPGYHVGLTVSLHNMKGWRSARELTLTARVDDSMIHLNDSTAYINDLQPGENDSTVVSDITFQINPDAPYKTIPLSLKITANGDSLRHYVHHIDIPVTLNLDLPPFPDRSQQITRPLAVSDLDQNGSMEIVFAGVNDSIYALQSEGINQDNFPVPQGGYSLAAPIVADVNHDSLKEIINITRSGLIRAFNVNGETIFEYDVGAPVYGNVTVAQFDDEHEDAIIVATMKGRVHAIRMDSTQVSGFPYAAGAMIDKGCASADLNGDGYSEVIAGSFDGKLHVINRRGQNITDFPVDLSSRVCKPPLIIQKDTTALILAVTLQPDIQMLDKSGRMLWNYSLSAQVSSLPAVGNWNSDEKVDIFFATEDYMLYGMNEDGEMLPGFPKTIQGRLKSAPLLADLNGDDQTELIAATSAGTVYIYESGGINYPNFPAQLPYGYETAPAIADIDLDGDRELMIGSSAGLFVYDIPGQTSDSNNEWITYMGDNRRTGSLKWNPETTNMMPMFSAKIEHFKLFQNHPNPFNPRTVIQYTLPKSENVILKIYNLLGKEVDALVHKRQQAGHYGVTWDASGRASGIYIYQLKTDSQILTKRMLYLK